MIVGSNQRKELVYEYHGLLNYLNYYEEGNLKSILGSLTLFWGAKSMK